MPQLPAGTVTFLFTDIEGSTRLLQEHPRSMGDALARHHDLLHAAVESNGGTVFETLGDGVYASFARASNAVQAAITAQQILQSEDWGPIGSIRVRMGLHTGDVEVRGEHYFGPALFRCSRLMSVGHGGQVLLSRATRDLVGDALPAGATIRNLGIHRLKDLAEPTEVYQLMHPDLQVEFPPLNSLDALANNLPVHPTRFIGREREVAAVRERVLAERLVTVTGMGGAGKTRLALQVAADLVEEFADGVWLVEYGPVADPAVVAQTLATVLSVREEPGRPPISTLVDHVRSKQLLLLLDSCEHLVPACADLANTLLRAAPGVHILVTSREVLGLSGETTMRVPPLSLPPNPPPPPEALAQFEAVGLFVERARAANASFNITAQNASAVLEVCTRLDGIPLAIELAAARVRMLSVEQIAARLDDRFRLLTGGSRGALPRQQTLRALVAWSYGLLSEDERVLFRRLAVFAGGWTLEAAESVCAGDGLEAYDVLDLTLQLVDKSLVVAEEQDGQERYRMLETIREYARECLNEANEGDSVRDLHLAYFLSLAERASPAEYSPTHLTTLGREYDNVRAALRWAIDRKDAQRALRLAGGLWDFWSVRGYYAEGRAWLGEVLALPDPEAGLRKQRVRALQTAGHLANCQADYTAASALLEESRALAQDLGEDAEVAASLHLLGNTANARGELEQASSLYGEARELNRRTHSQVAEMLNVLQLADVALQREDIEAAKTLGKEAVAASRERGQRWAIGRALQILGRVAAAEGDLGSGQRLLEESLEIQTALPDDQGRVRSLAALARVAHQQGDRGAARQLYTQSLHAARESSLQLEIARNLEGVAELDAQDDPERALHLVGAAGSLRALIGAEPNAEESRRLAAWLETACAALGEPACAEARATGQAQSVDQAIAEAVALQGDSAQA
jgi:predicted ATPase/class 3 adenylate cyclase